MSFDVILLLATLATVAMLLIERHEHRRARRIILSDLLQYRASWAMDLRARATLGSYFDPALDELMEEGLVEQKEHVQHLLDCGAVRRRYRYDLTTAGLNAALELRLAEESR